MNPRWGCAKDDSPENKLSMGAVALNKTLDTTQTWANNSTTEEAVLKHQQECSV